MKRAFVYSIVFVVVFVVWKFSFMKPSEIYLYLSESIIYNFENLSYALAYGLWFKYIQWLIVFIFIYGWIKKVYFSRSTFFRGIVFGLLIGLSTNSIFNIYTWLLFFGKSMGPPLSILVGLKWAACFITAQIFAFTYDQLTERFLKPKINPNTVESDGQNKSRSRKRIIRKTLIYTIIFVVGFFILGQIAFNSFFREIEGYLKEMIQWNTGTITIKIFLNHAQDVIGFIWIYALLKKVYFSRSTFFRGIIIGLLIGMTTNAIFGIPLYLLSASVPFGAMMFAYIVLSWLACFITGLVIAFSYDQLVDRFLRPSVSSEVGEP